MAKKPTYEELEQRVNDLSNKLEQGEQIEQDLKTNEARFRLLYERAPLGYQSLDADGNFVEVNQAWLDTLGYTREEVIGSNFGDFLHPDWVDHFKENFPRFKAVGEILGVEFIMATKDGSQIVVSFDGKIGLDEQGEFKQTHCILSDITEQARAKELVQEAYDVVEQQVEERTAELAKANDKLKREIDERKQAEEALRESEEKYRSMMESMRDPMYICSPDYHIEYMNPAMIKRTGRDAVGEPCYKVINELNEKCPWCVHDKVQQGEYHVTEIASPKDNRTYSVSHSPIHHLYGSVSKLTIYRQ